MPDPIDLIDRQVTHNNVNSVSATTPTGDEVINITYRKQNVLLINVKPSELAATATVKIWVYDDTSGMGWIPLEEKNIPRPGYDNTYPTPIYVNTKFQSAGITVTALSAGTIKIDAAFIASDTV